MTIDENFSTDGKSNTDAIFPFVYIHLLPPIELGNDLENDVINGAEVTFQIDVIDESSQSTVQEIMNECLRIIKTMRFTINQMPEFNFGSYNRQIARFKRVIGSDDNL